MSRDEARNRATINSSRASFFPHDKTHKAEYAIQSSRSLLVHEQSPRGHWSGAYFISSTEQYHAIEHSLPLLF